MTNAEIIATIRAEIDKRYAEYREKMKTDDFTYYEGMADALDLFEQFVDSLESENPVPSDLEEAALKFADREYMVGDVDRSALYKGFWHGGKWQKEQMMKGAAEGWIARDGFGGNVSFSHTNHTDLPRDWVFGRLEKAV